jgi:hypothetical protein
MKTSVAHIASLGMSLVILGTSSVAMAIEAPQVSDQGWRTLESMFNEAKHSAASSGNWLQQTTVSYTNRLIPVYKTRPITNRVRAANVWARQVIRGKAKEARRVAEVIAREQAPIATAQVQVEKIPSRERLVRATAAKLPNECSEMHTHERSRCLYNISLQRRDLPAVFASIRGATHAAAQQ